MKEILEAYVTNLGKYNEGELIGEWVKFPVSKEEYQNVLERIGIKSGYEEVFITDYKSDIYGLTEKLGEYENIEGLNYLAGCINELSVDELDMFETIIESGIDLRESPGMKGLVNLTQNLDCYTIIPDVTDASSYGEYIIKNYIEGVEELPTINGYDITTYLDAESIGRDANINEMGMYSNMGYVIDNQGSYLEEWDGTIETIPDEYRLSEGMDATFMKQEEQLLEETIKEIQLDMMTQGPVIEP